jgi:hypothetical protein
MVFFENADIRAVEDDYLHIERTRRKLTGHIELSQGHAGLVLRPVERAAPGLVDAPNPKANCTVARRDLPFDPQSPSLSNVEGDG